MSGELQGKVCLLTGATGGMGRAITATFLEAGAHVVASDLRADDLADLAANVGDVDGGAGLATRAADVSSADDVAGLVAFVVETYGRLDTAVNAAAIELETVPVHELPDDDFDRIIAVNLRSVFLCMKHEIRAMLAQGDGGGSIVNIASTNSFKPQPNQAAYTASKHGVLGLTRSAASTMAPEVSGSTPSAPARSTRRC